MPELLLTAPELCGTAEEGRAIANKQRTTGKQPLQTESYPPKSVSFRRSMP